MLQHAVALDEFGGLWPAVLVRLEFGIGGVDVEIGVSEFGINFDEDQSAFEISRGTLDIVLYEMFRLELGCNEGMIRMDDHIEVFFVRHGANLLKLSSAGAHRVLGEPNFISNLYTFLREILQ
jgi:hypothetical protein